MAGRGGVGPMGGAMGGAMAAAPWLAWAPHAMPPVPSREALDHHVRNHHLGPAADAASHSLSVKAEPHTPLPPKALFA